MIETELAWAAGFFDGEGCTRCSTWKKNGKTYACLRIAITQIDTFPLERFKKAVGVGKIYGPRYKKGYSNPSYEFICSGTANVNKIIDLISPYLSAPKLEQIKGARKKYEETREKFPVHKKLSVVAS